MVAQHFFVVQVQHYMIFLPFFFIWVLPFWKQTVLLWHNWYYEWYINCKSLCPLTIMQPLLDIGLYIFKLTSAIGAQVSRLFSTSFFSQWKYSKFIYHNTFKGTLRHNFTLNENHVIYLFFPLHKLEMFVLVHPNHPLPHLGKWFIKHIVGRYIFIWINS